MILNSLQSADQQTVRPNRSAQRQTNPQSPSQQKIQKGQLDVSQFEESKVMKKSSHSNSGVEKSSLERNGQLSSKMYISIQQSPPNKKATPYDTSNYDWSSFSASPVKSRRKTTSLNRGVFELPRINSPDIQHSQHEIGLPPNIALHQQKDKLADELEKIIRETANTKSAVQDQEEELIQLKDRLAQLRQFQEDKHNEIKQLIRRKPSSQIEGGQIANNSSLTASISPKKKKIKLVITSPQQQQNVVEATALTSSIVITDTALSVQEQKAKLRKTREEIQLKEDEIKSILQVENQTRIKSLEESRLHLFQEVISLRQALDRSLLYNKLGTLMIEHKQEDVLKVYNDRIEILKQDKLNLARQYQQLWTYNKAWINKIDKKKGIPKLENKSKVNSPQKSTTAVSAAVGGASPDKLPSPSPSPPPKSVSQTSTRPQVVFRPPQTQQQKAQEAESLRAVIKEKEESRALKATELESFLQASNQDLTSIQGTNNDLRDKVSAFRALNEKLFREMRVKTERIIETPVADSVKNDLEAERQRMLKILEEDDNKFLISALDGFEFSSMNIEEIHRRLAVYREQQEQANKHIQAIIGDCELSQEKSDQPPSMNSATFSSFADQQQKTLTLRDLASRHRADGLTDEAEDFPILQSSKNSKRQLESLHLLLSKTNLATQSEVIQQDQQKQFDERQINLISSKNEEATFKLNASQLELHEQAHNTLAPSGGSDTGLRDRVQMSGDRTSLKVSSKEYEEEQKKMKEEIEKLVQKDPNQLKNKNRLNRIMHVNQQQADAAEKGVITDPQSEAVPKLLQPLSAEQWKSIREHIDGGGQELHNGVESILTPKIISTIREITEENMSEHNAGAKLNVGENDQQLKWGESLFPSNPKAILDGIMAKFNYVQEREKYMSLISKNAFKQFPNPALQSRRIEYEITPIQADFLKRTLQFDANHFQGDLRSNRTSKSLNNQKYLKSTQTFSDLYIQPQKPDPRGYDFAPYTSTEDFTSHSVEHYTAKKQPGKFEKLIEDKSYLNRFLRNFMMMPSPLESAAFKIGEKIPFFTSPQLGLFKGTIVSTQQQVSIARTVIKTKSDLLLHEADTESISRISHPFVLPPIASFIEKSGTDEMTFYRIYSPIKMSLRNYIAKNLSKLSTKDKLVIAVQIAMAVFACHCKKYVLGGILDLDHISIEEIPNEKRRLKVSLLQLMSTEFNHEKQAKLQEPKSGQSPKSATTTTNSAASKDGNLIFMSPEAEYNRYLEYRSDVYAIASLVHYFFSEKHVTLVNGDVEIAKQIPLGVKRILQACLLENYRDRISSAGICIALQQLLDVEDPKALQSDIFFTLNSNASNQSGSTSISGQNIEILPFEPAAKTIPIEKSGIVYLHNGCYFGTMDKDGKYNSKEAFVFSLDRSTNSIQAIVSDFKAGLYQFAFAFNIKLETLSIHQREGDQVWFSDSKSDDLVKTSSFKGYTIVPNELEDDFITFLLTKKFKLLDDCGSILIGGFGQCGLHGVGVKSNPVAKTIALGVFEDNIFVSDGIDYQQSRIYNYIPQRDFKILDRGMCELSNSFQIGPLNMTQATPSLFLRYTDSVDLTAKIIRYTNNFRFEYILLKELVILCMQRRSNLPNNQDSEKVIVVLNVAMQLHSFLPASNASFISDISLPGGNFGIALDIKSEVVYAGLFRKKGLAGSPQKMSSLTLEDGFVFSSTGIQTVKALDLMSKINNMSFI